MAHFYGINIGQHTDQAVTAESTQSKDVEIQISATTVTSKKDLLVALERLENFITQTIFPPA